MVRKSPNLPARSPSLFIKKSTGDSVTIASGRGGGLTLKPVALRKTEREERDDDYSSVH